MFALALCPPPAFPSCLFALLGTMRSTLLLAAILALSLALGAVCEESQEQVVRSGGRREVRHHLPRPSRAALAEYWAASWEQELRWF